MSTEATPSPGALASGVGTNTAATPTVGVDPLYSDCVLKTPSAKLYYTVSGVFASCSPVFAGLVECCGHKHKPSSDLDNEDDSVAPKPKRARTEKMLEIPLEDPEEQILTLVEHLHQPDRFLASVIPRITKEGAARILNLTPIAFKYDMQGLLRQMATVLESPPLLSQFISHHENGSLLATWAFACKYRLETVLQAVEARIQSRPGFLAKELDNAKRFAGSLPSSSADLGLLSLVRMLHNTSDKWLRLATAVNGNADLITSAVSAVEKADPLRQFSGRTGQLRAAMADAKNGLAS